MSIRLHTDRWFWWGVVAVLVLWPTLVSAAEGPKTVPKPGQYNAEHQTIEMFEAIDQGVIQVKLIPHNSKRCNVLIHNKSDQPLNVKLPEVFAGVPVLAQRNNRIGNRNNNNINQGFGGGFGGMGMGFMNIPPEKVGRLEKVATVCLEHGKREPRAAIPYEIRPLESFSDRPAVRELVKMLGQGRIDQRAAQVAAWHLNNDMSFEELAAERNRHANGTSTPYFSLQEIQRGMLVAAAAVKAAKQRQSQQSLSASASLQ